MLTKSQTPNPKNATEEGQVPTGKLSFRDYLVHGISRSIIKDGEYDAKIVNIQFMQHPTDPEKDYLRLEIQLDFDGRIVVENRFVSGYFIFEREIKIQLGLADTSMPVPDFLAAIKNQPIKVWYKSQLSAKDNRVYQNMHFAKPVEAPAATEAPAF